MRRHVLRHPWLQARARLLLPARREFALLLLPCSSCRLFPSPASMAFITATPRRCLSSAQVQCKCSACSAQVHAGAAHVQRKCSAHQCKCLASASAHVQRKWSASGAQVQRKCSANAVHRCRASAARVEHGCSASAAQVQRKCSASAAKSTATRDCAQVQPRLKFCATSTQILHKCSFNSSSAWAQLFAKCTAAAGDGDRVQPKWRWGEGGAPRGSG